jgi:hypothetical protein
MVKPIEPKHPAAGMAAKPKATIRRHQIKNAVATPSSGRSRDKATRPSASAPEMTARALERRPTAAPPSEPAELNLSERSRVDSATDVAISPEPARAPQDRTDSADVTSAPIEPAYISLPSVELADVPSPPAEQGRVAAEPLPKSPLKPSSGERTAAITATAMARTSRAWAETAIQVRHELIAFACHQTELGLTSSHEILTSGSLPRALTHQAQYVSKTISASLAHALELARLSNRMIRAGLESLRPE